LRLATLLALALLAIVFLASAAEDPSVDAENTVGLASDETLGTFLVDGEGMTLYRFEDDDPGNGTSACYDACADRWPIFFAADIRVPEGLELTDFQGFRREDGTAQTTYKGWPLYRYFEDKLPGDVKGQGLGDVWFVVNP
jgi:predicted lipoprotein with Yx(FWY)xxD motif